MNCLIVFHSLTHAQTAAGALARSGIPTTMVKPPVSLGRGSCAHGLLLREAYLPQALTLLKKTSRKPLGIYLQNGEKLWKEIKL